LYRDGRVRSVLFFKNNEIVSVERYKETGERIHLGQMNKE
jgi:hypothetical protein